MEHLGGRRACRCQRYSHDTWLGCRTSFICARDDILRDENAGQLEVRLSQIGADATIEAVDLLKTWDGISTIGTIQDKSLATKAPRINKSDGRLDFAQPAIELERKIRGYQPWPGAFGELVYSESKRIQLHLRSARAIDNTSSKAIVRLGQCRRLSWDKPDPIGPRLGMR